MSLSKLKSIQNISGFRSFISLIPSLLASKFHISEFKFFSIKKDNPAIESVRIFITNDF